jgi:hypothetical protein
VDGLPHGASGEDGQRAAGDIPHGLTFFCPE